MVDRLRLVLMALLLLIASGDTSAQQSSEWHDPSPHQTTLVKVEDAVELEVSRESFRRHAHWFESFATRGRVVEMSGTHHLFISNAREVLREVEEFVSSSQ